MNRRQIKAMWVGVAVVVVMALFPPWRYNRTGGAGSYSFIMIPPGNAMRVDLDRLMISCTAVGIVTAGVIVTRRDPKP